MTEGEQENKATKMAAAVDQTHTNPTTQEVLLHIIFLHV